MLDLSLDETVALTKLIPEKPLDLTLERVLRAPIDGPGGLKDKEGMGHEDLENVRKLRDTLNSKSVAGRVLLESLRLEGSVRGTGIHASAIIIAPVDLTEIIPVCMAKDSELYVTQFEGKIIEDAGVIKMDFLGLSTLTILKNCLALIKQNHDFDLDIDNLPLDDAKTYELFQRGETYAIFQYESPGMQKYMKELKPTRFEDLIAMNALYRPGPIAYIPEFIDRKHGRKEVAYDLPEMEEYLGDTYGITVYQEQVMLLSQKLAGFTKGDADVLRKAMGKKDRATLDKMKDKFIEGVTKNKLNKKICEKVWTDWEAFAQYAFNKSHSTCYAFVAYQTAYLKAHYPAEYMAANLTNELGDIKKITAFMEETRRMGLQVLGPDVNESIRTFNAIHQTDKKNVIRFGLGGVKGAGDAAVESIIEEREKGGPYKDIFEFITRVNLRTVNKKTIESLAYAGAFDSFEIPRAAYFLGDGGSFIETLIRYANRYHEEKAAAQVSLFGAMGGSTTPGAMTPRVPNVTQRWSRMEELNFERDVVGIYISGHPLDDFRIELDNFCSTTLDQVHDERWQNRELCLAGIVTKTQERYAKNGNPFCIFTVEDYGGVLEIALFGDDYVKHGSYIKQDHFLFIRGKMQSSWRNQGQFEFKPTQIQLLPEVREKLCKQISIELNLRLVSRELINKLNTLVNTNPGPCNLLVTLKDVETTVDVTLLSRKVKVSVTNEMLSELEDLVGKERFRLN